MRLSFAAATFAVATLGSMTLFTVGCGEAGDGTSIEQTASAVTVTTTIDEQERVWASECRPSIAVESVPARITLTPKTEGNRNYLLVKLDSPGSRTLRYVNCGLGEATDCAHADRPVTFEVPLAASGSVQKGDIAQKADSANGSDRQISVSLDRDLLTLDLGLTMGNMGTDFACNDPGFEVRGALFLAEEAAATLYGQL